MKKIISIILAFMTLSVTAFANDAEDFAALLDKQYDVHSASFEMTIKSELNKPLDIIKQIPDFDEDGYTDIDPKMLAEGLIDTEIKLAGSYSVSEDYKKMTAEMYAEFSAPVNINENLKIDSWTKMGFWLEYDYTDAANPIYRTVTKNPIEKKYSVFDMSEYYKENPDKVPVITADTINALRNDVKEAFTQNADITKRGETYTVKFTDKSLKNYILKAFESASMLTENYMLIDSTEIMETINDVVDKADVFGSDALTITLGQNKKGFVTNQTADLHIDMNVYDIISAFDGNTNGLQRDGADIDLNLKLDYTIADHNSASPSLPKLTDKNSDVTVYSNYNDYTSYWDYESTEPAIIDNGVVYYPYESMGKIIEREFKTEKNGDTVVVTSGDDYRVEFSGNKASLYGQTSEADAPVIIYKDGKPYCSDLYYLGMSVYDTQYDLDKKELVYKFWKNDLPQAYDEDEEDFSDDAPENRTHFWITSDRALYMANDTVYVPIYDMLDSIAPGEFSFSGNGFMYTAECNNSLNIKTVSAYIGDKYITVNGDKIDLPYTVENINGVMRVPLDFVSNIGLDVKNIHVYSDETDFLFIKQGTPDYDENADYSKDIDWFNALF